MRRPLYALTSVAHGLEKADQSFFVSSALFARARVVSHCCQHCNLPRGVPGCSVEGMEGSRNRHKRVSIG
jgi:hypothetical protein